ncbi:Similar to Dnajc28: DnaJ homolog subfamily C member 28 (Mus musculus) [Cotesia congregata]|uniref:Similar to Dnajc28: DnaJ homolog subfamily C member 28 (Mus musculus) n=1 Tax=Cotesia congregata TaxID=51543 RepID=A0A8J2MQX6_COTCN|nr:Similar to Dnajc28: DnaJ homolog subfamily C member 28 (Mus musculus) [Cotesia congregata]
MLVYSPNCSSSINKLSFCLQRLKVNIKQCRYKHRTLKKSYETLGLKEDCEDEDLRLAFVHLAKQYHPDSGSSRADSMKFSEVKSFLLINKLLINQEEIPFNLLNLLQIESAYRLIQRERSSCKEDNDSLPEVEEFDIKHTAPQHRHFLAYDTGIGTPSERQRRHTRERAQKAVDNVMEHRLQKIQAAERNTLVGMDKRRAGDIKTRFGIDRLVEDLIQESMNKGEFKDLPGMGKPLKDRASAQNPYVDFVTHKLNEILIDNGFTPEWIQLSKEIREETKDLENYLTAVRNELGPAPLSFDEDKLWQNALKDSEETVKNINKKINTYNLLVPILQKQMLLINLDSIAKKVIEKPPSPSQNKKSRNNVTVDDNSMSTGMLDLLSWVFDRKKT